MENPKLRDAIVSGLVAVCLLFYAWKGGEFRGERLPEWLQLAIVFMGIIFLAVSLVTAANWFVYTAAIRLAEIEKARVLPAVQLATAVRGLSPSQTQLVSQHDKPNIMKQFNKGLGLQTFLVCSNGRYVPDGFVHDFLIQSEQSPGFLWSIRRHDVLTKKGWHNTEDLSQWLTNSLVSWGMARPAVGNKPAELVYSIDAIANRLGIDLG